MNIHDESYVTNVMYHSKLVDQRITWIVVECVCN